MIDEEMKQQVSEARAMADAITDRESALATVIGAAIALTSYDAVRADGQVDFPVPVGAIGLAIPTIEGLFCVPPGTKSYGEISTDKDVEVVGILVQAVTRALYSAIRACASSNDQVGAKSLITSLLLQLIGAMTVADAVLSEAGLAAVVPGDGPAVGVPNPGGVH